MCRGSDVFSLIWDFIWDFMDRMIRSESIRGTKLDDAVTTYKRIVDLLTKRTMTYEDEVIVLKG